MRNINEIVFIVEQEEDGGFVAEAKVNDNEQIITEGGNVEELKSMDLGRSGMSL